MSAKLNLYDYVILHQLYSIELYHIKLYIVLSYVIYYIIILCYVMLCYVVFIYILLHYCNFGWTSPAIFLAILKLLGWSSHSFEHQVSLGKLLEIITGSACTTEAESKEALRCVYAGRARRPGIKRRLQARKWLMK